MKKYNIISLGLILSILPAFGKSVIVDTKEKNPVEYTVDYVKKHLEEGKKKVSAIKKEMQDNIKDATDAEKVEIQKKLQKKLDEAESQVDELNKKLKELSK
jgi:predicted RNase H-like nuclease (RuvC/YqgF family)